MTSVLGEENLNTRTPPVPQRALIYFNTGDRNSPENLRLQKLHTLATRLLTSLSYPTGIKYHEKYPSTQNV